jgi:DHA2 family methylenomycin A resistance protein-like MFS transporter
MEVFVNHDGDVINEERAPAAPSVASDTASQSMSRSVVLVVMCVGYFLVLLDVTVINVALPGIGRELGADLAGLQWVVDGYALALAALLLAGGTLSDQRGHKRVALGGLVVFGSASLACGLAPSAGALVAARVIQGAGAALLLPATLAIITRAFPERGQQARAIGIWAGVGSMALPAGPLLGGALVDSLGWRTVFFVNVPIVLVAGVVAARVVRESTEERPRRLDRAGIVLAGLLLAVVAFAVIEAGHRGPGPLVIGAAVLAVALLGCFVAVERATGDPMFPLSLLRRPAFTTANAVAGAMNLGTLGLLFLLTLYLQTVQHRSALAAGVAVLPLFLPLTVLAPVSGRITARFGPVLPMTLGLLIAAGGVAWLAGVSADSGYLVLLPALLAWGVGLGLLTPAVVAAAVRAVEPSRAGLAAGLNNTARQAGGVIGVAGYGAIAGSPALPGAFVAGLHSTGLLTAALFVTAAIGTVAYIPAPRGQRHRVRVCRPHSRSRGSL